MSLKKATVTKNYLVTTLNAIKNLSVHCITVFVKGFNGCDLGVGWREVLNANDNGILSRKKKQQHKKAHLTSVTSLTSAVSFLHELYSILAREIKLVLGYLLSVISHGFLQEITTNKQTKQKEIESYRRVKTPTK